MQFNNGIKLKYNVYMSYKENNYNLQQVFEEFKDNPLFNFESFERFTEVFPNWIAKHEELIERQKAKIRELEEKEENRKREEKIKLVNLSRKRKAKELEEFIELRNAIIEKDWSEFRSLYKEMDGLYSNVEFSFIHEFRKQYKKDFKVSLLWLCENRGVSDAGYYKWKIRGCKIEKKIDPLINEIVISAFNINRHCSGYDKLTKEIKKYFRIDFDRKTVYKYMKLNGFKSISKNWGNCLGKEPKQYKENDPNKVAPNVLKQKNSLANNWKTNTSLEKLSIDEKTILLGGGKYIYNISLIDSHTNNVLAECVDEYRDSYAAVQVIKDATKNYNLSGSIIHSDRAKIYLSDEYKNELKKNNVIQSMNDRPISIQNYPIEKYFDNYENEFLKQIPLTKRNLNHIKSESNIYKDHYNYIRIQTCLENQTPNEVHTRCMKNKNNFSLTFGG